MPYQDNLKTLQRRVNIRVTGRDGLEDERLHQQSYSCAIPGHRFSSASDMPPQSICSSVASASMSPTSLDPDALPVPPPLLPSTFPAGQFNGNGHGHGGSASFTGMHPTEEISAKWGRVHTDALISDPTICLRRSQQHTHSFDPASAGKMMVISLEKARAQRVDEEGRGGVCEKWAADANEYTQWGRVYDAKNRVEGREELERDLTILGATALEDKLQEDSQQERGLTEQDRRAFAVVINGDTLAHALNPELKEMFRTLGTQCETVLQPHTPRPRRIRLGGACAASGPASKGARTRMDLRAFQAVDLLNEIGVIVHWGIKSGSRAACLVSHQMVPRVKVVFTPSQIVSTLTTRPPSTEPEDTESWVITGASRFLCPHCNACMALNCLVISIEHVLLSRLHLFGFARVTPQRVGLLKARVLSKVRLRAGKTAASVLGDNADIVTSRLRAGNRSECLVAKRVSWTGRQPPSRLRVGNASASGLVNDVDIRLCTGKPIASGLVNDRRLFPSSASCVTRASVAKLACQVVNDRRVVSKFRFRPGKPEVLPHVHPTLFRTLKTLCLQHFNRAKHSYFTPKLAVLVPLLVPCGAMFTRTHPLGAIVKADSALKTLKPTYLIMRKTFPFENPDLVYIELISAALLFGVF
ncbi:hypothetical protein B0H11DRAFT_1940303 [Mycena galericulata]|nr:hypothetical protein B0H11DRAFT_1940303 [Mycena galericulata]